MRILLITQYYLPQPLANAEVIGALAQQLGRLGHDVVVVSPVKDATHSPRVSTIRAIGHFSRNRASIVGRIIEYATFTLGALWSGLHTEGADVVLVPSPPLTLGAVGVIVARKHRIPLVYNVQDLYPEVADAVGGAPSVLSRILRILARWIYRSSSAVVVIDPAFEATIHRSEPSATVYSVRNGIDRGPFASAERDAGFLASLDVPEDRPVLMYAGNVGRSQDLEPLAQAADSAGATLVVHGGGAALADLKESTRRFAHCVRFSDYVERDRLGAVFASADLHVIPLRPGVAWASVPSKLLSVFSAARPVVLAAEEGSPAASVLAEADAGWLVAPADPDAIRSAVVAALLDTDSLVEHGRSAAAWAYQHAGHERMASEWEAVLAAVVDDHRKVR